MENVLIQTEKMIVSGLCIAHLNGKTVFVSKALPEEELSVKIISSKKDYDNAVIDKIIKKSPYRITPLCPYSDKCGGCNLNFCKDEYQKQLRLDILYETFFRSFHQNNLEFSLAVNDIEYIGGETYGYRNRFQFHDGTFFENKSLKKVIVKNCPVACDEINLFLSEQKPWEKKDYTGRIQVFGSKKLTGNKYLIAGNKFASAKDNTATVKLLDKYISFDIRGFFQSNLEVLEKVLPVLTEVLQGKHLLDMYCGVGTLSAFTVGKFENYTLVEHNAHALSFAKENLKFCNLSAYPVSGEDFIKSVNSNNKNSEFDCVIIDPPRSGLEKSVLKYLCENKTKIIRSLSCDPVTHARDIAKLVQAGYKLKRLILCDFYPGTSHIESLAFLES